MFEWAVYKSTFNSSWVLNRHVWSLTRPRVRGTLFGVHVQFWVRTMEKMSARNPTSLCKGRLFFLVNLKLGFMTIPVYHLSPWKLGPVAYFWAVLPNLRGWDPELCAILQPTLSQIRRSVLFRRQHWHQGMQLSSMSRYLEYAVNISCLWPVLCR